jgi:hypothetical protein
MTRLRRDCEYYDIGGEDEGGESDCLNRRSPRFQTRRGWTCIHFFSSTSENADDAATDRACPPRTRATKRAKAILSQSLYRWARAS